LGLGLDLVGLGLVRLGAKDPWEVFEIPLCNVVIRCIHAMDKSLDCEALVANYKSVKESATETLMGRRTYMIGFRPRRAIVLIS
jgi:hypothetical protein